MSDSPDSHDDEIRRQRVAIVGQGPVSLALRAMLLRAGFRARDLITQGHAGDLPDGLAARAIALSAGSLDLLSRIGVTPPGATIAVVDIGRARSVGHARLEAREFGREALGRVVRYRELYGALAAAQPPPLTDRDDVNAASITILADGDPGEDALTREFAQLALQAEIQVTHDQPGVAFERFTGEGPLALLPLPEPGRRALVWCAPESIARERQALSPDEFERLLGRAFGPALGRLRLDSPRHVAPLARRRRRTSGAAHLVAIGNAAQSLHPVAGQGFNLGLRDAFVLANCLGEAHADARSLADAIQSFERARARDRDLTCAITDQLALLPQIEFLRPLQSLSLSAIDQCPTLRRAIGRGFMFGWRSI
jgi:2-octaprenyl-6-methoxyphenol hydroxylase